jgi:tRNA G10  N-methylase Trm11
MFASLCILGRQPALGLAELESLYGAKAVKPVGVSAALLDKMPPEVSFAYLGGTVKFCKVLTELDSTKWSYIQNFLIMSVPAHAANLPEGKMNLGLSVYGLDVTPRQITGAGLELKKVLKNSDRAVRVVPNKEQALNSAQILHNKLTQQLGWELVFVKNGKKTIVAQTIAVQDIEAYAKRDQARPKRDSKVGMLPPKLAQTITNMASGEALPPGCGPTNPVNKTVLDPFCGTGVILQEASLMGYQVNGTDIDSRMIEYSYQNLKWLGIDIENHKLDTGDATAYKWGNKFDFIASETYLGRPFTSPPSEEILKQTIHEVNTITKKFLQNLAAQTKSGFRLCIAVPAWHIGGQVKHLPVIDHLTDIGYNRVKFVHAGGKDLIYRREGQVVGRELLTLRRK